MSLCDICKKNVAVVFTTRFENNERINEGLCIKCAYDTGLGDIRDMFSAAGINDNNIDEVTERLNRLMSGAETANPQDLFKMLVNDSFSLDDMPEDDPDMDVEDADIELPFEEVESEEKGKRGIFPFNIFGKQEEGDEDENESNLGFLHLGKDQEKRKSQKKEGKTKNKFLEQYGTNLTRLAKEGKIDRLIGREKELERVVQILNRRSKNNPALIGEPGVGKTAVAEGLAVKIANGEVPPKLLNMSVYLLDMTAMVAGTQFRGQFESRMKNVVDEATKNQNVILVIDEMHNIMGAGDAEGAMNAANILKPALAKGEIRVIGSTTLDEYRRHIEKDSALERRFQKVIIEEPSIEDTIEILKGVKDYYEEHHFVKYPDDVIEYAVRMSSRYITDRFLPDKAIDVLDEAGSHANLEEERLVKLAKLKEDYAALDKEVKALEARIEMSATPEEIEKESLYEKQAEKKSQVMRLEKQIESLEDELKPDIIDFEDIGRVIEMWTGIPVKRISESESERLLKLEDRLHERVIGQEKAVSALARAIRRNRSGFGKKHKPSSFIFVGPTGVGKTELVKALAEAMFAKEDALIRVDMSEYMEKWEVTKFFGAAPGYVGYDDGGQLTEKVRRRPYSVILFDEIEKAHPDVFNVMLQILDDGRLTDSHGRVVNFENSIIIMTSNAGTSLKANGFGFNGDDHIALENRVNTALKEQFRPEFLNRVDEIVVFQELTREEIRKIVDLMLKEVTAQMKEKGVGLSVSEAAKDQLAKEGYDPKFGARPLRKTIQRRIEDPLADMYLTGKFTNAEKISVGFRKEQFTFDVKEKKEEK
ncbi:MAG: ATP-dependent Clp protease ATP-binding subunit [Clostridiales bacterium]|nr:ATP-dependent Clp protease ATP-binding subunit [Clostridiales bacterium]MBR4010073.1 ATP-dependent Clp protease ATP-binding subunit [Clostridiales bacterium]MCR5057574.1 ATP-dependent Clp protease ATP-binding subunit [Clostridiales bacterium]